MSQNCKCTGCETDRYYADKRKNEKKSLCSGECKCKKAQNSESSISFFDKNLSAKRNYKLILVDTGSNDGYFVKFEKEISIFDYVNLLSDYVGVSVDIEYNEFDDETVDYPVFELTEIKDFLDSFEIDGEEE